MGRLFRVPSSPPHFQVISSGLIGETLASSRRKRASKLQRTPLRWSNVSVAGIKKQTDFRRICLVAYGSSRQRNSRLSRFSPYVADRSRPLKLAATESAVARRVELASQLGFRFCERRRDYDARVRTTLPIPFLRAAATKARERLAGLAGQL